MPNNRKRLETSPEDKDFHRINRAMKQATGAQGVGRERQGFRPERATPKPTTMVHQYDNHQVDGEMLQQHFREALRAQEAQNKWARAANDYEERWPPDGRYGGLIPFDDPYTDYKPKGPPQEPPATVVTAAPEPKKTPLERIAEAIKEINQQIDAGLSPMSTADQLVILIARMEETLDRAEGG